MNSDIKIFMGQFWVQEEGGVYTLGLTEEALADFDEILSMDFPDEDMSVEQEESCGVIETSDGPIDLYSPVTGSVVEVNRAVIEDPSIMMEDPTGEGWLLKFAEEDFDEDEDEDDDENYDEDEDDYDDDDEEEDEEYEA